MTDFVGKYTRYPDLTGGRKAEGGKRLNYKEKSENSSNDTLVSIITVSFNSEKTIAQTINSVRRQTYSNIEYIIIDGCSRDSTVSIIEKNKDIIDYYLSEPDDGLYYAMNKGLELAQGQYILLLNSDDWYEDNAVETLVSALDYSGCDFVGGLARYIDEDSGHSKILRSMPFDHSSYLRMSLRHETMLVPARLYNSVGPYNTEFKIIADKFLTAMLFKSGFTYYEVPTAILNFRTSGVSNTNIDGLKTERKNIIFKHFPFLNDKELEVLNNPTLSLPNEIVKIANSHLDQADLVKACRAWLHDFRINGAKKWQTNDLELIGQTDPQNWPRISVILPFYEAESSISRCLSSVLNQTFRSIEIICINDRAIDGSQDLVDKLAIQDQRIKCVTNDLNLGLGGSRNRGIREARGRYIFHIDPDDTIPLDALEKLYLTAQLHKSDMVKGAYQSFQVMHGQVNNQDSNIKYSCGVKKNIAKNRNLSNASGLLKTTEGHWSYLYDGVYASRISYPIDLKMGQDSIFLVRALALAKNITITPYVIYNYEVNPKSAMNSFTVRKFFDALTWRKRAFFLLKDLGFKSLGENLLFNFWNPVFFDDLIKKLNIEEKKKFDLYLSTILHKANYSDGFNTNNQKVREYMKHALSLMPPQEVNSLELSERLKIGTFTTQDHGGAGLGTQRRVEALRKAGVDANIYCVLKKTKHNFVKRLTLKSNISTNLSDKDLRLAWRDHAVLTRREMPGLKAREMFSKMGSVVDFAKNKHVFSSSDVVHMHWVSGAFDFNNTKLLSDKPVVWTLADMNAFTGGCHYSEGCTNYKNDCSNCPLLEKGSDFAKKSWDKKLESYSKIKNLHIICPSQWLADCAKESSLFKGRAIHMIPNAIPVDRFIPTNKMIARQRLGLPLNKKLIVFGADSLDNLRKGGDILRKSIQYLKKINNTTNVEGVFFGANKLDLGIPSHSMGHVSDEKRLSLIYAAADVFAFPSREDNAPLTVVESMLSGTPVVSFPIGNVPELVVHKENGFIANYLDYEDFAKGLMWILNEEDMSLRLKRGLRAHIVAKNHNDPEVAAQRHIQLYQSIIN